MVRADGTWQFGDCPMKKTRLANYWHPIAPAAEITDQPRAYTLLGEKIVAYRTKAGVAVLKDLCIHRGTPLSLGRVENGHIVCRYHAWRFDTSGKCVHIPSLPDGASIPKKACVTAYPAEESADLVWVALDKPTQSVPGWTDDAWNNPQYRVFLAGDYYWKSSAGRAIENAMDFSHFNFVHKGLTELGDGPQIKSHKVSETDFGLEYAYVDGRIRREYSLHTPFTLHDKKFVIRADQGGTWSEGVAPQEGNATILSFIASPIDAKNTRFFVFIARNHDHDLADEKFGAGLEEIMEQDRVIVESQRPEEIPTDLRAELHLKVPDASGIAYRRVLDRIDDSMPFMP